MNNFWSQEEEALHLEERFKKLKVTNNIGQAEFARINGVPGGPSLLSQHIKNRRPINLEAAIAYAKGFACPVAEISPRLAKEIDAAYTAAWSPKDKPKFLEMVNNDLKAAGAVPGYSVEALALAWLLDQVKNRLDKKKAETEASAVILGYVNAAAPTHRPTGN